MDVVLRPFGRHVIVEPRSQRASRYVRRFLRGFTYSNGVVAASDEAHVEVLLTTIKNSRLEWKLV